jgi:LPS export ABC transporter protein LptC
MRWQKRARFGVAVFGIVCAGVVYSAIGERRAPAPAPILQRLDPKAILESTKGLLKQVRGEKEDYEIAFDRELTYQGGRTKLIGVRLTVRHKEGRDFTVTANEAEAGENQRVLQMTGDVKLVASDGFELATTAATYNQDDGIVRADSQVSFKKDRMNGYGTGISYNQMADVLTIGKQAHVEMHDADNNVTLDFDADSATLDRAGDLLTLDGHVYVLREGQKMETEHAVAHMDAEDQYITLLELRNNARVEGTGGSLDAMSARDIDLHYTDEGKVLQRVVLTGMAAIALAAQNGAAGRSITGDAVELDIAPDGSLLRTTARQNVRLVLPASEGTPARSIQATVLDATGEEGKGLTAARFTDHVEFREQRDTPDAMRVVRSQALQLALTDDSVGEAVFTGTVTFEEQRLKAAAAEMHYDPDEGALRLSGSDDAGGPCVADDQIAISAQSIAVVIENRKMNARRLVKTALHPAVKTCGLEPAKDKARDDASKLPGLLKQDQPANVNANQLDYDGAAGRATYRGDATLWQGETSIRADTIELDQQKGDVTATGSARAALALDTGTSIGRADQIRYEDARHLVTYSPPVVAAPARAGGAATPPLAASLQPQLSGPQGELRADRIEVFLVDGGGGLDRLEAYTNVTMRIDPGTPTRRTATGSRLTYRAASEQYDVAGTAAMPVKVTESCREITGKTLTFYKSTDRIIVDGNEEIRTETKSGGPCSSSASPRPARP